MPLWGKKNSLLLNMYDYNSRISYCHLKWNWTHWSSLTKDVRAGVPGWQKQLFKSSGVGHDIDPMPPLYADEAYDKAETVSILNSDFMIFITRLL